MWHLKMASRLTIAMTLVASPVWAEDANVGDSAFDRCLEQVGEGDRTPCIVAEHQVQDARLNAAYKKLAASLGEQPRKALRDEERQWIADRDRACGQGQAADNACALGWTSKRADALELRVGLQPITFEAIKGQWAYASDCQFGHYAELAAEQGGQDITGTWSDGTRVEGWDGQFRGHIADGRLYLRLCYSEGEKGGEQCPSYPDVDDGYLQLQSGKLVWLKRFGSGDSSTFERYVTLQRVAKGKKAPKDNAACPEAE